MTFVLVRIAARNSNSLIHSRGLREMFELGNAVDLQLAIRSMPTAALPEDVEWMTQSLAGVIRPDMPAAIVPAARSLSKLRGGDIKGLIPLLEDAYPGSLVPLTEVSFPGEDLRATNALATKKFVELVGNLLQP